MRRVAKLSLVLLLLACSERKGLGGEEGASNGDDATGASSDDGDDTASSTGGVADMATPDCAPILQMDGSPSGFEECMSSGDVYRVSAPTCIDPTPVSDANSCPYGHCFSDDDCDEAPYGVCQLTGHHAPNCTCVYGCTSDAECEPGQACMCAPIDVGSTCIPAECRTDDDCAGDQRCVLTASMNWVGPSLHCADVD